MRVGILSDVHGNWPALEAILATADSDAIERWLFLGDLVGYYYWPRQCLDALRELNALCIQGNHERMMFAAQHDADRLRDFSRRYGEGLEVALAELDDDRLSMVAAWPEHAETEIEGLRVILCHGAPWDGDAYVYPDAEPNVRERMAAAGAEVVLFGHTHYPVHWQVGGRHVVNPGSVGQPRDRRPGAHWAVWDTGQMVFDLRCVSYDRGTVIAECRRRDGDKPYLVDVLERTRR